MPLSEFGVKLVLPLGEDLSDVRLYFCRLLSGWGCRSREQWTEDAVAGEPFPKSHPFFDWGRRGNGGLLAVVVVTCEGISVFIGQVRLGVDVAVVH